MFLHSSGQWGLSCPLAWQVLTQHAVYFFTQPFVQAGSTAARTRRAQGTASGPCITYMRWPSLRSSTHLPHFQSLCQQQRAPPHVLRPPPSYCSTSSYAQCLSSFAVRLPFGWSRHFRYGWRRHKALPRTMCLACSVIFLEYHLVSNLNVVDFGTSLLVCVLFLMSFPSCISLPDLHLPLQLIHGLCSQLQFRQLLPQSSFCNLLFSHVSNAITFPAVSVDSVVWKVLGEIIRHYPVEIA